MSEPRHDAPSPSLGPGRGVRIEQSILVRRAPRDLYLLWRDPETIARIFGHVERIEPRPGGVSHWIVRGPLGTMLEWDVAVVNEVENHLIGWQSLPGADVDFAGSVHFEPRGAGGESEVRIVLRYDPPGGAVGAALAELLGTDPAAAIADDLARFKRQVESGRAPSKDDVQIASEDSFPASDPPAWTAR